MWQADLSASPAKAVGQNYVDPDQILLEYGKYFMSCTSFLCLFLSHISDKISFCKKKVAGAEILHRKNRHRP